MPFAGEARSQSAVLARYVSVDYVHELENGGVEIFLALCVSTAPPSLFSSKYIPSVSILTQPPPQSHAGGSIPRWIQNMAMTGQVFSDGRSFLDYLRKEARNEENEKAEKSDS